MILWWYHTPYIYRTYGKQDVTDQRLMEQSLSEKDQVDDMHNYENQPEDQWWCSQFKLVQQKHTAWITDNIIAVIYMSLRIIFVYTVEPLIKDTPRKGHCMLDLSTRDCFKSQNITVHIVSIHQEPPRRGQPLYMGQNSWIYIVPKVSFVRRFHCNQQKAGNRCFNNLWPASVSV